MDAYLREVRMLQVPSAEQTRRFGSYVRAAHSWYKHLSPFPPGSTFTFFLDPHAYPQSGPYVIVDASTGRTLSTAECRSRFGHWGYRVDVDPMIVAAAGELLRMPPEMKAACSCRLTAFVHRNADSVLVPTPGRLEAFRVLRATHPNDRDAKRYAELIGEEPWRQVLRRFYERVPKFHATEYGRLRGRVLKTLDRALRTMFGAAA